MVAPCLALGLGPAPIPARGRRIPLRSQQAPGLGLLRPTRAERPVRSAAPGPQASSKPCVVVCPGFLLGAGKYDELKESLEALGYPTRVVPIRAWDWWPTLAGGAFSFYLDRLQAEVEAAREEHGEVRLVGHSAGGWLARIYLGDVPYEGQTYGAAHLVAGVVTLGTPHLSQEAYPFGRVQEEREGEPTEGVPEAVRGSSLQFAMHFYPDGSGPVPTVCVAGRSVLGRRWSGGNVWAQWIKDEGSPGGNAEQAFAHASYEANCGDGNVWGDGVTPVETAILPGAHAVVLDDVKHNPGVPGWYGELGVVQKWAQYL